MERELVASPYLVAHEFGVPTQELAHCLERPGTMVQKNRVAIDIRIFDHNVRADIDEMIQATSRRTNSRSQGNSFAPATKASRSISSYAWIIS
jgi:hypothetical protein